MSRELLTCQVDVRAAGVEGRWSDGHVIKPAVRKLRPPGGSGPYKQSLVLDNEEFGVDSATSYCVISIRTDGQRSAMLGMLNDMLELSATEVEGVNRKRRLLVTPFAKAYSYV